MKKNFCLSLCLLAFASCPLMAQVNLVVAPDSVYAQLPPTEQEIPLPSYITNNTGGPVTIRWTRVVEQETFGWDHAFCDKNLCYFGTVSSKTFNLDNGEKGVLKPIFYPFGLAGMGVMRLYYNSETPGVVWSDTAVYVAVATELTGTVEVERVRDVSVFPNPANDVLSVVTAQADIRGQWTITDVAGKVWATSVRSGLIAGQIPIAQLPKGAYLLNVLTADNQPVVTKRFVVQR